MVEAFLEGGVYSHPKHEQAIMVLAIAEETDTEVTLAILWVNKEDFETTGGGELTVFKKDFKDWELVQE